VRLLFDLLSSCSGLLKHAAATTSAAVTIPAVDVQRAAGLDPCAVNGHRWQSPRRLLLPRHTTPPPSKTEVAAARGAVALAEGAMPRPPYRCCEPGVLDVVPLGVATGNVTR
jgi:hypothetical protein